MLELIALHMIDGRLVSINPKQITQIISPLKEGNRTVHPGVRCIIRLADGGFVSVAETCEDVEKAINK